jgi:hypothetical protein
MSTFFTETAVARELLAWHGHVTKKWNPAPAYEIVPAFLLLRLPTDSIVRTLDDAEVGSPLMEGAARFIASWWFGRSRARDRALVPSRLVERMRAHVDASPLDTDKRLRFHTAFGER